MKNIELEIVVERKIRKIKLEFPAIPPLLTNHNTVLFLDASPFVKSYKITSFANTIWFLIIQISYNFLNPVWELELDMPLSGGG